MVPITSLWLPILLSAGLVFLVSVAVWSRAPHHRRDFEVLPDDFGWLWPAA